ncbi:tyrosine-type recombinase/integrase [Patescibacteria group bacterium]|nr:tyrosine-type recombinase/integrase [Patescibacteria group bacterium]
MQQDQHKPSGYTLTEKEVDRLICAAKNFRDKLIVEILYYGGMRRAECVELDIKDIDQERKRLPLSTAKIESNIILLPKGGGF